jgi:L-histidine N-alpha-methyltransferase
VSVPGAQLELDFAAGETIRTEVSSKFTRARIERELTAAGLRLEALYTDPDELFAVSLAAPV